jgi:hypothetical protein
VSRGTALGRSRTATQSLTVEAGATALALFKPSSFPCLREPQGEALLCRVLEGSWARGPDDHDRLRWTSTRGDGLSGAAYRGGLGTAVRDQPPRPLRSGDRVSPSPRRREPSRVVALSSSAHLRSPVVFDDIHFQHRPYDPWAAYGQSKTANALFAVAATARWRDDGVTANARHRSARRSLRAAGSSRAGPRSPNRWSLDPDDRALWPAIVDPRAGGGGGGCRRRLRLPRR